MDGMDLYGRTSGFHNSMRWCDLFNGDCTRDNPTRTVHPFHGWIFQFRGIFVARVGQFERTKEAVDLGGNWPSLSNNSWGEDENFAITHASPIRAMGSWWPARISGYHENIPRPHLVVVATEISPSPFFKPFQAGPLCSTERRNRGRDRLSLYCLF